MIILDENRLSNDTIVKIGRDYGMEPDSEKISEYNVLIDRVIDRFYFDLEEVKERLVNIIKTGIKIDFKY